MEYNITRCLGAVTRRLQSPWQQRCRTEVIMTSLPSMYDNQAQDDNNSATTETTTTPPPIKPQRSFRQKHQEDAGRHRQDATAYLEGSDHMEEEEEAGGSQKERNRRCDVEEETESGGFYLEDRGSQSEDEDKCSEAVEEKDGESEEENEWWRQRGEVDRSKEEGGERSESADEEKGRDQEGVKDREKRREDGETGRSKQEVEGDVSSAPGRRSRVIRLYQYDEDGRRYDHLPEATAAAEPRPAPRLKQRSMSLSRLSAIMAAASAGPLDRRESGRGEERPRFHMEI
ncbi:high mobility group nucleosome-binding domain-containing protein 5 [Clinocottus analis]|uniref:high mobility group nucleosome-binding domain-containing protein 5 n=1 Tax=Clinocottus analis TaxID=304258 RepID=UPI0035BF659F